VTTDIEEAKESPDSIRRMLAYLCIATDKEASLETKVGILTRFELTNQEIARVCGVRFNPSKMHATLSGNIARRTRRTNSRGRFAAQILRIFQHAKEETGCDAAVDRIFVAVGSQVLSH
jgi:hypothetical protein